MSFDPRELPTTQLRLLAEEFKARPFGWHSPLLQALLDRLRLIHPGGGKLILVCTKTCAEWALGRIDGDPPGVTLEPGVRFTNLEQAEMHVFRLRWRELFGRELDLG